MTGKEGDGYKVDASRDCVLLHRRLAVELRTRLWNVGLRGCWCRGGWGRGGWSRSLETGEAERMWVGRGGGRDRGGRYVC